MKTQNRAIAGGQVGMNGEFYPGGTFLPTTTLGKMTKAESVQGTGKQEIEPYTWAIAPEGKKSLFKKINGVIGTADKTTAKMRTDAGFNNTLNYLGMTISQAQELIDMYNNGIRWI
jgi:hypothetical protein